MNDMKLLERNEIDDERWDARVLSSPFFRHYALTYYLDAACELWMGLTNEDYSWVWPVPVKKVPVRRVYQPLLIQQLGPFCQNVDKELIERGIGFLKTQFAQVRIKFNDEIKSEHLSGEVQEHQNFELDLLPAYSVKRYNRTVQSNLKKSEKANLTIESQGEFDEWCVNTFKSTKGHEVKALNSEFYSKVKAVFSSFAQRDSAICYTAKINGEKVAQVYLLRTNGRLLFLFSASNHVGKECGAMHSIVDAVIKEHSGQEFVLDFEGSNDKGLAYFYGSFGAERKVYLQLTESRLKWPLNRLIK